MRIYEGMFVLDERRANENWGGVTAEIRDLLERFGAEIFTAEKWDERRLAYPIKGRTRAVYYLVRFTAPPNAIAELEHQCQLNENILRVLFTRDKRSERLHKKGLLTFETGEEEGGEKAAEGPQAEAAEATEGQPEAGGESPKPEPPAEPAPTDPGEASQAEGEPPGTG